MSEIGNVGDLVLGKRRPTVQCALAQPILFSTESKIEKARILRQYIHTNTGRQNKILIKDHRITGGENVNKKSCGPCCVEKRDPTGIARLSGRVKSGEKRTSVALG
jgi:hypothetical protein